MTIASQSYRWNTAPLSFLGNSHFMRFYYLVEFIPREKLLLSLSGFIPERKREQGFNFSVYFFLSVNNRNFNGINYLLHGWNSKYINVNYPLTLLFFEQILLFCFKKPPVSLS
jgi:hypothetical protein